MQQREGKNERASLAAHTKFKLNFLPSTSIPKAGNFLLFPSLPKELVERSALGLGRTEGGKGSSLGVAGGRHLDGVG